jgi:tetratricopeptide (TPR) repeat protein
MLNQSQIAQSRESARQLLASSPQASLEHSNRLLRAGVRDADVLDMTALALMRLQRYALAANALEELRGKIAPDLRVFADLAGCYTATANTAALAQLKSDLDQLKNDSPTALLLKIRVLNALREHAACIPLCQQLLVAQPPEAEYWCMLAWHQQSCGELAAARDSYRSALGIDPHHVRAHYALSQLGQSPDHSHITQM